MTAGAGIYSLRARPHLAEPELPPPPANEMNGNKLQLVSAVGPYGPVVDLAPNITWGGEAAGTCGLQTYRLS
jgi:hypothetical protein